MIDYFFIVEANSEIGLGHINRMTSIASYFKGQGHDIHIFAKNDRSKKIIRNMFCDDVIHQISDVTNKIKEKNIIGQKWHFHMRNCCYILFENGVEYRDKMIRRFIT